MSERSLLAIVAVAVVLAFPTSAAGQVATDDSVTGSVVAGGFQSFQYDFSARSGPSGENPTGQVTVRTVFTGSVTCLTVRGTVALLKVQVPSPPAPVSLLSFRVTDNAGSTTPDLIEVAFATGPATECSSPETTFFRHDTVTSGDIVVTDAQPFPTSKEQCKNGGWRQYGVFKNQGDCVSFVATGGKNPPAGP
jgi:hypothetical protein